jgi:CubicO group peptidase (beta-lactamase class C family)
MITSLTQLKRTNPEAEGIPSSTILDFIQAVEQHTHPLDAVQGFMLLRHGNVAAEGWWAPYRPEYPHSLYSLSKSFTSTAIGLAVNEGRLTVDDPVLKFFPDEAPSKSGRNLKAMRVRHLLSMNTGHKEDTTRHVFRGQDANWARVFLSLPVKHKPGTWFVYNTAATYMLSAIITRLTGESLLDYLRPRLFEPLGIENPTWETDPRGINIGGTGLHIKTEDIARFGQLYLQKGMWQGKRIVPEEWIAEATMASSDNSNTQTNPDWTVGYGYQFWRCQHNAYRADGAFGQFCIVMPEQDAVLAMISGVQNMQAVLDKVWKHLLPAMQPGPLAPDSQAYSKLCDKLAVLALSPLEGGLTSPGAEHRSGKIYQLERNHLGLESVSVKFDDQGSILILGDERGEHRIQAGYSTWLKGTTDARGRGDEPIVACGAWTAEDTYEVRVCYSADAFCPVIRFHYANGKLQLEVDPNATWDWEPAGVTKITGRVRG